MKPSKLRIAILITAWIICGVAGTMIIRSTIRWDSLVWLKPKTLAGAIPAGDAWYIFSRNGNIEIGSENWAIRRNTLANIFGVRTLGYPPGLSLTVQTTPHFPLLAGVGFWTSTYTDAQRSFTNHVRLFRLGWWLIFLPLLLPTFSFTLVTVRHSREARRLALIGHCVTCGYDLRATPHQCPECGEVPLAKS
jgi:hypothetical protein